MITRIKNPLSLSQLKIPSQVKNATVQHGNIRTSNFEGSKGVI